ncbi:MAG: metal ABC transporter permease, partial [Candidatus Eisenbacteria bacterium]|nr:metal ABC transporter permease [Candidatus Eisenbacteria bacterium]
MVEAFQLPFFRTALLAILVLAGIHAYLGYHVVRRGVIFVDLAMAQMAALGLAIAVVLGLEHNPLHSYLLSFGMTLVGAACFAWLRREEHHAPLEAFIGIVFVTAQAAVFLVLEKSPAGPEHLKETLVGSLFTVDPKHVALVAVGYALIGLVHWLARRPIFEITNDPVAARAGGRDLFWWDFIFYGLFGLVVTSSVQLAGVLLVFGLLVIPAVAGLLVSRGARAALIIGWIFATVASVVGLIGSIHFDAPASPSILVALTAGLLVMGVV